MGSITRCCKLPDFLVVFPMRSGTRALHLSSQMDSSQNWNRAVKELKPSPHETRQKTLPKMGAQETRQSSQHHLFSARGIVHSMPGLAIFTLKNPPGFHSSAGCCSLPQVDPMFHPDCRKIGPSVLGASATPSPLWPQIGMWFQSRCNVAAPGLYSHGECAWDGGLST